jgi:hypothetical protein
MLKTRPAMASATTASHSRTGRNTLLSYQVPATHVCFCRHAAGVLLVGPSACRSLARGDGFVVAVGLRVGLPPGRHQPAPAASPPWLALSGAGGPDPCLPGGCHGCTVPTAGGPRSYRGG